METSTERQQLLESGQEWAETVDPIVAEKVARFYRDHEPDQLGQTAYGALNHIADDIFGEGGWGRQELEIFGDRWLGEEYPGNHAVCAFAEGVANYMDETP